MIVIIPLPVSILSSSARVTIIPDSTPISDMASLKEATSRALVLGSASDSHAWINHADRSSLWNDKVNLVTALCLAIKDVLRETPEARKNEIFQQMT